MTRTETARKHGRKSSSRRAWSRSPSSPTGTAASPRAGGTAPLLEPTVNAPGDLDVDHLVPLKNAHDSGGWAWNSARKEDYANYLGDPGHLIAVTSAANRSKGAKGPEEWRPSDEGYWCQYATDWTEVKFEWGLTMTQGEAEAVIAMLDTCEQPVEVEAGRLRTSPRPCRNLKGKVEYTSRAGKRRLPGESRVQGSAGGGRGFPEEMVPSARDGDGDGVVCEQ